MKIEISGPDDFVKACVCPTIQKMIDSGYIESEIAPFAPGGNMALAGVVRHTPKGTIKVSQV